MRAGGGEAAEERFEQNGGEDACPEHDAAAAEKLQRAVLAVEGGVCGLRGHRSAHGQAEHHVGDDAGDGYVEPEGEGPAGDGAVLADAAGEREEEGYEDQRERDDGEENVAAEEPEIKGAKGGSGGVLYVSVQRVVQDVADQKERGEDKGGDHGRAVPGDFAGLDEGEADEQGDGAEAVQDGVERRQKGELRAGCVRGGVHVNQPEEKERGRGADDQDGGDGGAGVVPGSGSKSGHNLQCLAMAQSMSAVMSRGR